MRAADITIMLKDKKAIVFALNRPKNCYRITTSYVTLDELQQIVKDAGYMIRNADYETSPWGGIPTVTFYKIETK